MRSLLFFGTQILSLIDAFVIILPCTYVSDAEACLLSTEDARTPCDQREALLTTAAGVKVIPGPATEDDVASIMFYDNKCKFTLQQIDRMLTYEKQQGIFILSYIYHK